MVVWVVGESNSTFHVLHIFISQYLKLTWSKLFAVFKIQDLNTLNYFEFIEISTSITQTRTETLFSLTSEKISC